MRVGLVFNPETPLEAVLPYLEEIDILLFMSVHPGFGGQSFIPEVLDKLQVIDISNNLGDAKSLITHPATTTHRAMGPEGRAAIGLGDGVVRVSIGLEGTEDLIADLDRALS